MLLGLVHVNTGPLSRPQALAEAALTYHDDEGLSV